jgi:hypothetical protein
MLKMISPSLSDRCHNMMTIPHSLSMRVVLVGCLSCVEAGMCSCSEQRQKATADEVADIVVALSKQFGVIIQWKDAKQHAETVSMGQVCGENPAPEECPVILAALKEALREYPQAALRNSNIRRIVLLKHMQDEGVSTGSLSYYQDYAIYFDVVKASICFTCAVERIHHEIFHFVDWLDDGSIEEDIDWMQIIPDGFEYSNNSEAMQADQQVAVLTDELPGFINRYATSAMMEDKAEVFANLMVRYAVIMQMARNDIVLNHKIRLVKTIARRFCDDLDEQFWSRVRERQALKSADENRAAIDEHVKLKALR